MKRHTIIVLLVAITFATAGLAAAKDPPEKPDADKTAKQVKTERGVETATRTYIKTHGLKAFAEEYYNLLGTKPKAIINEKNKALALALGLGEFMKDLPVEVPKEKVLAAVGQERLNADRKRLSAFFSDKRNVSVGKSAQQQMLGWHFAAADNYRTALTNVAEQVCVGWNVGAEVKGNKDFSSYSFGIVGCTVLAAVAKDGTLHMSHWDQVANPKQIKGFDEFQKRFSSPDVYVVGRYANDLGAAIKARHPNLSIHVHTKETYLESNYTVRIERKKGKLKFTHANTPLANDYIASIHNGSYGRWFAHGRFSEIIPPNDKSFVKTTFQKLDIR